MNHPNNQKSSDQENPDAESGKEMPGYASGDRLFYRKNCSFA